MYTNVKGLLYATVHCLMMDQWDQIYVGFCSLKHYGDSDELCGFVGLQFKHLIVMHRVENLIVMHRVENVGLV